jgi:hypothetical protein
LVDGAVLSARGTAVASLKITSRRMGDDSQNMNMLLSFRERK